MKHKSYKTGDLKAEQVDKKKGDMLYTDAHKYRLIELQEDCKVWTILKLDQVMAAHGRDNSYQYGPAWVHSHYSLEDPSIKWNKEKEDADRIKQESDALVVANRQAAIALKDKKSFAKYNSWYMRIYRLFVQKKSVKASVLKE